MFYSQVILAKKGPLAKVWLAAHWGDKKLARPQIFATDISQSCTDIMNPSVPLALRLSGHLLLGVVRIYSRKVKYVLNDCTEAMLKLQMAFAKQAGSGRTLLLDAHGNPILSKGGGGRELLSETDAPAHQLVANFGEFDQVHIVEGFCLPLPEDNEWILADDNHGNNGNGNGSLNFNSTDEGSSSRDPGLLLAAHLPTNTQQQQQPGSNPLATMELSAEEEEETWAPFDPDNEEEDEEAVEGLPNNSRVSDIEIVRAANDSILSEDQTRRSTSLLGEADKSTLTDPPNPTANDHEDNYDFNVPFGDDSEDEKGASAADAFGASGNLDDSALQLSRDGGTPLGPNTSGLAMDEDDSHPPSSSKRPSSEQTTKPPRKRRRKRRKVIIDNHETELTNDHIRAMLQDSDTIVQPMLHPASLWDEESTGKDYKTLVLEERAKIEKEEGGAGKQHGKKSKSKPQRRAHNKDGAVSSEDSVPCLTRPFLADGSGPPLHRVLEKLWQDNYWKALGEPCPYRRLETASDVVAEQTVDDVETVRRGARTGDDESTLGGDGSDLDVTRDPHKNDEHQSQSQQLPEDDDLGFPTAVDDEEDEEPDAPVPDFEDEEVATAALQRGDDDNDNDLLELGMVNDMVLDSDEDHEGDADGDRQALGSSPSSSSNKWHKHTVRVFAHLKKCLRDETAAEHGAAGERPDSVTFHELTKHVVSRRNASSVFFEMLQLKTWDFIELNQDESYGDIAISAGVRFGEDAPKHRTAIE